MTAAEQTQKIKHLADQLGFDACGIAKAEPIGRSSYLRAWLDAGRAGTMEYLHRHFEKRADPRELLPGARSVIVVAQLYHQSPPESGDRPASGNDPAAQPDDEPPPRGRVAMYAWGRDYHDVLRHKLWTLVDRLRRVVPEPFDVRVCVDTAPLLERELAAAAGIGWIGKNTLVLSDRLGSYFFLGAVVTTLDLAADEPMPDHCGACTACLDACPTAAFPAAHQMDASRCISYLTIEHRGDISRPFQELMGDWMFGCDVCQQVCPFNRHAPLGAEPQFAARPPAPTMDPEAVLGWSPDDYRRNLSGSAMKRATLDMLQRNARIVSRNA